MVNGHFSDLGLEAMRLKNCENEVLRSILRAILRRTGPLEINMAELDVAVSGKDIIETETAFPVLRVRLSGQREVPVG